jgi:Fur family ferric uptake transcriptional regulator
MKFDCDNTRKTHQRQVVLETLRKTAAHPTADELYEEVRKKMPRVSLGTVYRNLEILSTCGEINKLDLGEGKKRFDARMDPHHHFLCKQCGRVYDLPFIPVEDITQEAARMSHFKITGVQIGFEGICDACLGNEKKAKEAIH